MDPSRSENFPSTPPIKPPREKRYIRRTVTFNVGHFEELAKSRASSATSESIRQTRSLGAADYYGARRSYLLEKPEETLTTTYTSWIMEGKNPQERAPHHSSPRRIGLRRGRLLKSDDDVSEPTRFQVKVGARDRLISRYYSALDLSKKASDLNAGEDSLNCTIEDFSGGKKVRLSSSRMWSLTHRRKDLGMVPEGSQGYSSESLAEYTENSSEGAHQSVQKRDVPEIDRQSTGELEAMSSNRTDDSDSIRETSTGQDPTIRTGRYRRHDHRHKALPRAIVGYSTDEDRSSECSSLPSTNINFLHDWRPSPPSDLLNCCGCDRCCSILTLTFQHESDDKASSTGRTSPNLAERRPSCYTIGVHLNSACLTPGEALILFGHQLSAEERMEIKLYREIYYLGPSVKERKDLLRGADVTAYEDENGNYLKLHEHLAYRYEILEFIGTGVSGQVVRSLDHKTGKQVAIKILRNTKCFTRQGLSEIRILDRLRRMDPQDRGNAVRLVDYFYFRSHLCISLELLGMNLHQLLESNNFVGFDQKRIRKLAGSMIQSLQFLLRQRIIHGDLKPENVMLKNPKSWSSVKLIDFGSACYRHQWLKSYVQSRFYRSPEVILGLPYGCPIDMWSFGCILAEIHTGRPIFCGDNEVHQLALFVEVLGTPPKKMILGSSRRRLFFDSKGKVCPINDILARVQLPGSRNLASILKDCDPAFLDFVSRCFEWDPTMRMTPDEARRHEWLAGPAASYPARSKNGRLFEKRPSGGSTLCNQDFSNCCIS